MPVHVPETGGAGFTITGVGQDAISTPSGAWVWRGIDYSPDLGLFVAVAATGPATNQFAMTSPDGETWTSRTLSHNFEWRSVAWSPDLGLFAAVANGGTASTRVATSPDGITWTFRTTPSYGIQFTDVVWGDGRFVAVGDGVDSGSLGYLVSTSDDGITWNRIHAGTNKQLSGVAHNAGGSVFVAVALVTGGSDVSQVTVSNNAGQSWSPKDIGSARDWFDVAYSPSLGRFFAVGASGAGSYSDDNGETWNYIGGVVGINSNVWSSVEWSEELGIFISFASSGVNPLRASWSFDGITWHDGSAPISYPRWRSVYVNSIGAFITVGSQSGNAAWRSCLHYTSP